MACTYGASVKSGVDPNQQIPVDRSLWESVTGTPASWLDPLLDAFTQEYIKASDLCALNLADPALPNAADIAACVAQPWSCASGVYTWIRDKLRYAAFANTCTCNVDPGAPETTCEATGAVTYGPYGTAGSYTIWTKAKQSGCTSFRAYCGVPAGSGYYTARADVYEVRSSDGATLLRSSSNFLGSVNSDATWRTSTAGYDQIRLVTVYVDGDWNGHYMVYQEDQKCGATPTPPTAPIQPTQPPTLTLPPSWSCGSYSDLCTRLQQMSQRLVSIDQMVTLIQRQHVPFAYVSGAAISISGSGVVAVQAILGVLLALSDSRSGIGSYPDNPTTYFDLGWLSFCTPDGCENARRITRHNDVFMEVSPVVTTVHYSLPSGVSGTLTPLLREP